MSRPNRLRLVALLAFASVMAPAAESAAGRRPFIWTWDAETLATGDLELEQWMWGKSKWQKSAAPNPGSGWLWFSPVYGLYDRVEIAFPWEVVGTSTWTRLSNFTLEVRIPLHDRNDAKAFVRPLLRVFGQWNFWHPDNAILGRESPWAGGNLVVAFGDLKGTHATVDVGGWTDTARAGCVQGAQTLGLGATVKVTSELRAGAEYFHEYSRASACTSGTTGYTARGESHFFVGPNVAFSRGRVWATLGVLFGRILDADRRWDDTARIVMPRLIFSAIL